MDFPINEVGSTLEMLSDNWELLLGYALAAVAGFDKVAQMFIKTLANVRDAWYEAFPKIIDLTKEINK